MSDWKPRPTNPIDQEHLEQLRTIADGGPVLVITHDSPDPDALASGKALATLFQSAWNIPARLLYSGLVARAENRAMLNILTPEWREVDQLVGLEQYSAVALVDTQPEAGNNSLPSGIAPQIVIDHHHPVRESLDMVPYVDVRPDVGSTVSLVYQHLESAGVEPDAQLATAMFYGLQTDTNGLARGASPADEAAYMNLLNRLDRQKLIQVAQAGLSRDYFRAFSQGLHSARLYEQAVIAYLDEMQRPDLAAEMADMLIRLESARAALCLGYFGKTLHISLRTESMSEDAGLVVQRIIPPLGRAGGHGTMAGGQISLEGKNLEEVVKQIESRFLEFLGETGKGEPLLPD